MMSFNKIESYDFILNIELDSFFFIILLFYAFLLTSTHQKEKKIIEKALFLEKISLLKKSLNDYKYKYLL